MTRPLSALCLVLSALGAPAVALAGLIANDPLENAIGRCVDKEGATGDAVGELVIDLKTGKTAYRCASDPVGESKPLSPTGTEASPKTPPSVPTTPTPTPPPAPDVGAKAVWVNRPSGPPPERPQDCVSAHPAYKTLPVCVIAARMGLYNKPELNGTPPEGPSVAAPASAPTAPVDYSAPPPPFADDPASGGAASPTPPPTETTPFLPPTPPTAPAALPPTMTTSPPPLPDSVEQEAKSTRTIVLPEGAEEAIAQARAAREKEKDRERDARVDARTPGASEAPADDDFSFLGLLKGIAVILGGVMGLGLLGIGLAIAVHRIRVHRAAQPDDPYVAYFDNDRKGDKKGGGAKKQKGRPPVPENGRFDDETPLSSFDEAMAD